MPAPLPDRQAVEADLTPEQLTALRQGCAAHGIAPARWPFVPALRGWAVFVAAGNRVRQVMEQRGAPWTQAVLATAVRYGIGEKALEASIRRAAEAAIRGHAKAPKAA